MLGVQTETTTDAGGGLNVGWIDTGDWMAYNSITVPSTTSYLVEYRVASPNSNTQLSLDLNAGSIQLGALNIPNTGGWQNWTTISHTVNITAGTYNFGIYSQVGGWNINWWRITKTGAGRQVIAESITDTPKQFMVHGYPNPFNHVAKIYVGLPSSGYTEVTVFGAMGNKIGDLYKGRLEAGHHEFDFNAEALPPGIYLYSVTHNGEKKAGKLLRE
jgi:hypothetical protein